MTSKEEFFASLDKGMRDRLKEANNINVEFVPTPSIGLNVALGGGFGMGRMITVHGTKSAGKSAFVTQTVANAQKMGKFPIWIDAENCFQTAWAERLGLDTDNMFVSKANDMIRAGDEIVEYVKKGADVIVIDSVDGLLQPSFLDDKNQELAGMEKTQRVGDFARWLKAMIRSINYVNDDALIIFIAQESFTISPTGSYAKVTGGQALEYYSSQMIRLRSNNSQSTYGDLLLGEVYRGDMILNKVVGRKVHWSVEYNKVAPQGDTGEYEFFFRGDKVGVDDRLELIKLGTEYGVLEKAGNWMTYVDNDGGEHKYNGTGQWSTFLQTNEKVYKELKENVQMASAE